MSQTQLAIIAKGKAAAVVAVPVIAAMPAANVLVAACTLPTLLGYWKSEYGVSYACEYIIYMERV